MISPLVGPDQLRHGVPWRDLVRYRAWETAKELCLPLPWLALFVYCVHGGYIGVALLCSFYFFLTSLRLSHNAFHYALGLPRFATDCLMLLQSTLMLGSLHAVQFTHLKHHRHALSEGDVEGRVARQGFWEVLLKGPVFPLLIHYHALKNAVFYRRIWMYVELSLNALVLFFVYFVFDGLALKLHYAMMMLAYSFCAFFAVWTVHRGNKDNRLCTRTLRGRIKNLVFYNMFLHFEHHAFPRVPTCHLPILAQRIDDFGYVKHESVF